MVQYDRRSPVLYRIFTIGSPCAKMNARYLEEGRMTTKELIVKELGTLDEDDLDELYRIIQRFLESKKRASPPSLMSKLKRIRIYAPADFATNLDLYVSGEKSVQ